MRKPPCGVSPRLLESGERTRFPHGSHGMARGDPVRVRAAVLDDRGAHAGYVTTVGYPDRDISAFAEGTPFFEIAVADLSEAHVALVQRFRRHWLVRCGPAYEPTDTGGELTAAQVRDVAALALSLRAAPPAARAARLCEYLAALFPPKA